MPPRLIVEIIGDTSRLEKSFKRTGSEAKGLGASVGKLSVGFGQLVKGVIVVDAVQKALEGLHETVHLGIEEFSEHAKVSSQTEAALKSTGGVANVTAKQIDALGLSLSNLSGVDDELIQSGANVLLAFQNIRDFAGKGNQIFTDATKATLDFAVRSGRSVPAAAVAIGRALQDPAKAAGSLRRAYVVLTSAEKSAIASAVKHGDILKAQQLIIADLNKRYGGAAEAVGKTLPGQLNILRDRFKDLAGQLVGVFVPATTKAVTGLTDFVKTLAETQGTRAKIDFTIDSGRNAAKELFAKLRAEFDAVDWATVAKTVQDGIRAVGPGIARAIGRIDFAAAGRALGHGLDEVFKFGVENVRIVGRQIADGFRQINFRAIGRDLGNNFARVLDYIGAAARRVDWNGVGRDLVRGAEAIVVAVARFLAGVDWGRVLSSIGRLVGAAAVGLGRVFLGIGEQLGKDLLKGVGTGISNLGDFIGGKLTDFGQAMAKKAIKIVLDIIEPFTHLPKALGGGPFQQMKTELDDKLAGMVADSKEAAKQMNDAFANVTAPLVGPATPTQPKPAAAKPIGSRSATAAFDSDPPLPPAFTQQRKRLTAAQLNQFFDNAISSQLTRAGLLDNMKQQIGALQRIAGLISARIAATKDVTRRRTLEDQLLQVQAQIRGDQQQVSQQAAQDFLASLQFGITKAQATATFKDDIARLTALKDGIQAQIKATGDTLDLEQQLFDVRQQLTEARNNARNALQFKALGLTAAGDDVTPGIKHLKAELNKVGDALSGTFLDTKKTQSLLSQIKKVLSGGLGAVGQTVRAKVQEILDGLEKQLKDHAGNLTKFRHVASDALLAGLGLSPDQLRELRSRVAQVGAGGTVPGRGLAFAGAGASAPLGGGVSQTFTGPINNYGITDIKAMDAALKKRAGRRSGSRRGPNAGR